jgi:hypothetical protein
MYEGVERECLLLVLPGNCSVLETLSGATGPAAVVAPWGGEVVVLYPHKWGSSRPSAVSTLQSLGIDQ